MGDLLGGIPLRKAMSLVSSMIRAKVDSPALFKGVADRAVQNTKELNPTPYLLLVVSFSEIGFRHEALIKAVMNLAMEAAPKVLPKDLASYAQALWTLGVRNDPLMQKIGEAASMRLQEYTRDDLEKIECAYGAHGFVIPDEWVNHGF